MQSTLLGIRMSIVLFLEKRWVPLRMQSPPPNLGGKSKRGSNQSNDSKSHSHLSSNQMHSSRSTPPLDRAFRSHSPSSTSSNELPGSKHSYGHAQYGQYPIPVFLPNPGLNIGELSMVQPVLDVTAFKPILRGIRLLYLWKLVPESRLFNTARNSFFGQSNCSKFVC